MGQTSNNNKIPVMPVMIPVTPVMIPVMILVMIPVTPVMIPVMMPVMDSCYVLLSFLLLLLLRLL